MVNALKQRLVGALILVALGVVFWPIIFVAPEPGPARLRAPVPRAPVVDTTPLPLPEQGTLRASPASAVAQAAQSSETDVVLPQAYQPAAGEASAGDDAVAGALEPTADNPYPTRNEAPIQPALDEDGIPIAWVLQVATVSERSKANQLRDELIAMKFKAYVTPLRRADATLFRVYVGPKFERAAMEALKQQIDLRYGVESLVARYVP